MATLHAKSQCCRAQVYRLGGRRRQCSRCGRTWSIRQKRRGPEPYRVAGRLSESILLERVPVGLLARRQRQSPATIRRRIRQAFGKTAAAPSASTVPDGDLVLLIDGLWSMLRGRSWVLYNMALKPVSSNSAWFLDPYLRAGRESVRGWRDALATIPQAIAARVRALVADGIPGIDILANDYGWPLQLCHRHLLSSLDLRLGHRRRQRVIQRPGRDMRAAVAEALVTSDEVRVAALCQEILQLARHPNCTVKLRYSAQYFVRHQREYRMYLLRPELRIPTTTSAVESMHSLLRKAISTANTANSLLLRTKAFLRLRPTITCNGAHFQQKL